jgi:transcriptional regulator ATRX
MCIIFLHSMNASNRPGDEDPNHMLSYLGSWKNGADYFRMDGSTAPAQRKTWCNYFNKESNHRMRLFLISTKAGGLGINLVAANRVIIFDASWNPGELMIELNEIPQMK